MGKEEDWLLGDIGGVLDDLCHQKGSQLMIATMALILSVCLTVIPLVLVQVAQIEICCLTSADGYIGSVTCFLFIVTFVEN